MCVFPARFSRIYKKTFFSAGVVVLQTIFCAEGALLQTIFFATGALLQTIFFATGALLQTIFFIFFTSPAPWRPTRDDIFLLH